MPLSNDLLSQFAKATSTKKKTDTETTVYGTIVEYEGEKYVRLDGSDMLTPFTMTAQAEPGERVSIKIKNHTATVTGNISSPAARVGTVEEIEGKTKVYIDELVAGFVSTEYLEANYASLVKLEAVEASIDTLEANDATINGKLTANEADIEKLKADTANIENLNAGYAKIDVLESQYGDIHTLIFGSATGDTIQTSFANAVIAQLGDAQIKSAMIESVAADKITAGEIITNDVTVKSADGRLIISDETIQISDENRVRVQIGKDASNDYSINIWDADGNLMFSQGGITDKAIKEAIIRNDMVSENANISASKLDIDSLFTEINNSDKTIKSTKVYLDEENQTLDVSFKSLTTDVEGLSDDVSSQGTQISAIQGQIESKIWQQDIDSATGELSTEYSDLKQTVNGISGTVASHTAEIADKADKTTVKEVQDKVASLELTQDSFQVSVSKTYTTKQELADLEIGGCNLIQNSDFSDGMNLWVSVGVSTSIEMDDTYGTCLVITSNDVGSSTQRIYPSTTENFSHISDADGNPGRYSLSFYAKTDSEATLQTNVAGGTYGVKNYTLTTSWQRYTHTYDASSGSLTFWLNESGATAYITKVQVEHGDKVTDWAPAPDEMMVAVDLDNVATEINDNIDNVSDRVEKTETRIRAVENAIASLVVDKNGESLMIQDGDSWYFNTSDLQGALDDTSANLASLIEEFGSLDAVVEALKQKVNDLDGRMEYIRAGTYTYIDEKGIKQTVPSLELGEADSEFKQRITNTNSVFLDGMVSKTSITNDGIRTENIEVTDGVKVSGMVEADADPGGVGFIPVYGYTWKVRKNGNFGLMFEDLTYL